MIGSYIYGHVPGYSLMGLPYQLPIPHTTSHTNATDAYIQTHYAHTVTLYPNSRFHFRSELHTDT